MKIPGVHNRLLVVLLSVWGVLALVRTVAAQPPSPVQFARDVQPLLAEKCLRCHGPDPQTRAAALRLDREVDAKRVLASGQRAVVPGDVSASELLTRVRSRDVDLRMPPPDEGPALDAGQIELLEGWIQQGAQWQRHWAFLPLDPGLLPTLPAGRMRNPVDTFIGFRLRQTGQTPSPAATRVTLIKRLYYDLLGLPPAPREVDAFVRDDSPTAYEELVDRLLHSPHFGERWARHWLDKARFADTNGYESDQTRTIWPFRDWVIEAINRDLAFDQFTVEQLAGDMLPNATAEQLLATAFHRNTMTNAEGGTDNEEFRVAAVVDRVNTTMQVWMGMTAGCAQCHDHKYDALTQRNYYELFAVFNQTADADSNDNAPLLSALTQGFQAETQRLDEEIAAQEAALWQESPRLQLAQKAWESSVRASSAEGTGVAPTLAYDSSTVTGAPASGGDYGKGMGLFFTANRVVDVTALGTALREPKITDTTLSVQLFDVTSGQVLQKVDFASGATGEPVGKTGALFLYLRPLQTAIRLQPKRQYAIVGAGYNQQNRYLNVDKSSQMGVTFHDGDGALTHIDSKYGGLPPQTVDPGSFTNKIAYGGPTFQFGSLSAELRAIVDIPAAERTAKQRKQLARYFRGWAPELASLRRRLTQLRKQRSGIAAPETPVLRELPGDQRRQTHIHVRGDFRVPGAAVEPAVPDLFMSGNLPVVVDRLSLARWLVDPANPLVARVQCNAVWKNLLGEGIVRTMDDFGIRGERPTHPRLLDYLAARLRDGGWSRKRLIREVVLSATYRQSSLYRPEFVDVDPTNRLWHRQGRFRVEAEIVRDLYLAASGLLTRKIGGASVFPPLPPGIAQLNYDRGFTWETSQGSDRYRRGMYTFFKRTAPHPNLMTLDSPESNVVCLARNRSNTPLGALVTLNNEVYVEAAQALARRAVLLSAVDDQGRLVRAWRFCVPRNPTAGELQRLHLLLARSRKWYRDRLQDARQRVGVYRVAGCADWEVAAWIAVSRVILNLDEVTTRD
ncbi:MAG: PSD1 and planctomycete cytochrome C domain-containing protein [Planctomycetota bacterium]|nr:PSD1 and planctomycete cytochrome C domain-containing protein [Planctomycetota bacterium]